MRCQHDAEMMCGDHMLVRGEKKLAMSDISKGIIVFAMTLLMSIFMVGGWFAPESANAALQYVGGTSATGTGATYNVSLTGLTGGSGSAAAAGDLVIVVSGWASAADGNPGITTPTGYTEVLDLYSSDTRDANLSVSWKIMGGTPDSSVTVSGFNNAANGGATVVHVWRGADQTTPLDVTSTSAVAANNAGVALPDSPAITPVTVGAYVLTVGLGTGAAAPTVFTAPSGYGNVVSAAGAGSTMGAVANIASVAWAGGAVDPGAWTGTTSVSDSWTAGTLAIRPAVDSLSVTANTPVAATAAALATNVQMQMLQVDSSAGGDNSCVINSITVDDLGTAGATDITNLKIHIDNDNNFGNGVLGTVTQAGFTASSTPVSMTALSAAIRTVTNGTSKYIWITYDLAAGTDGKTIQSSVTTVTVDTPDTGATGTWSSNNVTIYSGPASTINSCGGCHGYPPADGSARNTPLGALIGDHAKHGYVCSTCHVAPATETSADYGHRNGNISVKSGSIGVTDNGTYTRGASFAQSNAPTPGSCDNVNCHGNNNTGAWGGTGYASCATSTCHGFPPATNAHLKHYTSKTGQGWTTGDYAFCVACHPDDFTSHADRTDGVVELANLTKGGISPAITCSAIAATGCHNTKSTPAWNTTGITCSNCHVIGGGAAGDPTSGLHATTNLVDHDGTLAGGTGNPCEKCHTASPSSLHFNGAVNTAATATFAWATNIPAGYDRTNDYCAATCHTDAGTWNREWSGVTDVAWGYANDASTTAVCGNCHGSFFTGWNIVGNTTHDNPDVDNDPDTLATSKGSHSECSTCHAWGHTNYTTGVKHENNFVEMNSTLDTTPGDGNCTTNCHAGQTLTMNATSGWTDASVVGAGVTCGGCHTGGVTPGSASGAHDIHGATSLSVAANPASIALCISCHGNDGTGATHNNGSVNFVGVNYSTAVRNDLAGTCVSTSCHNYDPIIASPTKDQSTIWSSTALACDDCHYYAATTTPTSAGNSGHARPLTADHANHFGTGGSFACADCHGTDPVAGDTSHISSFVTLADKAVAAQNEATVTLTGWNGTDTCNNAACHNPSGTTYSAIWQTSTASCTLCHSATDPGTGSHNKHMTAATNFGINTVACTSCHVNNGTNNAHRNGTVTFTTSPAVMGYSVGAVDVLGTVGTCTTTTCHNNGLATPTAVVTPTWGVNSADCTICHANPPATAKHAEHVNATYVSSSCIACHTAATATTHINNARNMDTAKVVYTTANQTCTNNCHIANTAGDWTAGGALACADCHGSGKVTTPDMDRGFPPTSGAHTAHIGNTAYVTGANCTNCHNDNTTTHSTLNNVVTTAIGVAATNITANPGNGSCTNDCHAAATAGDWTGGTAAIACIDCHSSSYVGSGANGPSSGLHNVTPSVTGVKHDNTVSGGCATCHPNVMAQTTTHIKGTFTGGVGQQTQMGLAGFYTQTADNTGTCATTTCHVPNSDAWAHKWDSSLNYYTTNTSACEGCHGDMTSGFNAGVTHLSRGPHTSGTTYGCKDCHVIEATTNNYTFAWITGDWFPADATSKHGNSTIEVNTNGTYNQSFNTCDACHSDDHGNPAYAFVDTGWTIANLLGDGVSGGTCGSCHGYPPIPGDGKTAKAIEGKGAHAKHVTHIAARAGVTLNEATDTYTGATVTAVCGACHNVSSDTFHSTGGGSRNMLIPTSYQFGISAPVYNGTEAVSSSTDPKSCSNLSCHFKETPVWAPVGGE